MFFVCTLIAGVERLPLAVYNLLESVLPGIDPAALRSSLEATGAYADFSGHDILRTYHSSSVLDPSQGFCHRNVVERSSDVTEDRFSVTNHLSKFQVNLL